MVNKTKYLIILFTLLLIPLSTWCATYKVEINGVNYSITGDYVTVIAKSDGTKYSGNIVIPDEIEYNSNTYTVKSLGSAFNGCDGLLSLQLPNTIESIGSFSGCSKLKDLVVPDPVTQITETAFSNCSSLESITIGPNITKIGNNAFNNCNKLKSVFISDLEAWCKIQFYTKSGSVAYGTLTYNFTSNPLQNGADLYLNGEKLINLVVPESITTISHFAFRGCSSFETITISDKTEVYPSAFSDNKNLRELYSYAKSMSSQSFSGCTSLSIAYLYNTIGAYDTFEGCTNLETVLLPKSIVEADQYYSSDQREYIYKIFPNVHEFIIPEGTTRIGHDRFHNCTNLVKVSIPSSITTIVNDAFRYSGIKSIYITDLISWCNIKLGDSYWDNTKNSWEEADPRSANPLSGGVDLYLNNEKLVNLIIPDELEKISNYKFSGCTSIQTLTIPKNITNIETSAFNNCSNLEKVVLPSTPIEFAPDVFNGCERLTSVGPLMSNCSIEYGWVTNIPSWAFSDITNLQTIIIPSTIKSIGDYAFRKSYNGVKAIENIYINAITPPAISSNTFSNYDATLFVPKDCKDAYSNALYWKSFNIIELVDIESIEINKEQYDIIVGESTEISVTILPEKATYKDLYWSVEDPQVAKIDNGVVLGLKTGTTRVTAKTTDGTDLSATCLINVTNPVKSITLSKNLVELEVEESETIIASCTPSDADDISISWNSKDTNIATVINGKIKAISVGETEVAAKSVNGVEAICKVIVNPTIATSLKLNKNSLSLTTGNSYKLEAVILPVKTTNKTVKWESSNSNIVSVDNLGVIKALSNGTARITASTNDGSNLCDVCTVTVTTLATSISLNQNNANLIVGQSLPINATILPTTTSNKNVTWQSNNSNCASVSSDGIVYANATGTATISVSTTDGTNLSADCIVNVTNPVKLVTLSRSLVELETEESETINASCTPSDADDTSISWYSKNTNIATVNNGKIDAIGVGETEVVAKSVNGIEAICKVVVKPTIATSLKLDKNSLSLTIGKTDKLEATILPIKTTNKTVKWESNNSNTVSVDDSGFIKALSNGTAIITATTIDGSNLSDECIVTVTTLATDISLNLNNANLIVGQTLSLSATILPSSTSNKDVTWQSNNSNCASVSSDGIVYANATGTATITATTTDGTNLTASCVIVVTNPVISVTLDKTSAEMMVNQQITITASCIPSNADNTNITWSSSDITVATVSNGIVTAKKLGVAIVTASSANGVEAKCSIKVVPTPISSLTLSESAISIVKNQSFPLSCTINPNDATNKELIWSSDNESIARVDVNGVVTGISTGETMINVNSVSNPIILASCKVIVSTPITSIKLDQEKIDLFVEDDIQLIATCLPIDADNKNVRWVSSNSDIAAVTDGGYVKAKNKGSVRITVSTTDGTNLSASCDINVKRFKQSIIWNDELSLLNLGGEMMPLEATSSSGLSVKFISNDDNIVSLFDLRDVVYVNPVNIGKTYITSYQEGNYKYEPVESRKEIEVVENPGSTSKTLIAYYTQSVVIDGIVAELANQIANSNASVYIQKIEPMNDRINSANTNSEVRDSVMNIISLYPNDASSYPTIKAVNVNISDYDNVILVYPLWNSLMAAPMQTFCFSNKDILKKKSIAYIEYDLYDEAESSSNAEVLRFNSSNIDEISNIIEDWLNYSESTGILQIHKEKNRPSDGIYDLQGRRVTNVGERGLLIIKNRIILK